MEITISRLEHFLKQIDFSDKCWVWKLSSAKHGYGQFWDGENRKNRLAHRVSYEVHYGSIPTGLHVDHLCRNRLCVNPDHLEAVTQAENNRREREAQEKLTHCKRGHEFDAQNTYTVPSTGSRQCKRCVLEWQRVYQPQYRARKKVGVI